jgi:hypothetical protein
MAVVEKTERPPSYIHDINKYGGGGEKIFLALEGGNFSRKKYRIFDVTKDKQYQFVDVDFVISKDGAIDKLPEIEKVLALDSFEKVEVKVDTRALETGNLPYEVVSHGSTGWSVLTKATYVYMILCIEGGGETIAKKIMWIDMNKWHSFAQNRNTTKKLNIIKNESIVDLLCRINDMREYGVILSEKDINFKV